MMANRHDLRTSYRATRKWSFFTQVFRHQGGINRRDAGEHAIRARHMREAAGTTAAFFACVVAAAVISVRMHPPPAAASTIPLPQQSAPSPL
jgi:hypothetical protein